MDFMETYLRYKNLNFYSYIKRNTVEFRQHHATLDFDEVYHWVSFCTSFVNNAKKGYKIQSRMELKTRASVNKFVRTINVPSSRNYWTSRFALAN